MPRIPSARELGERPVPRPTRGVADYGGASAGVQRAAAIQGRVADEAGAGWRSLAKGLTDFAGDVRAIERADDRAAVATARAAFATGLVGLDREFADDKDWQTLPGRVSQRVDAIHTGAGRGLSDSARQAFDVATSEDRARAYAAANKRATAIAGDHGRAWLHNSLDGFERAFTGAIDGNARQNLWIAAHESILAAEARGYIDAELAARTTTAWKERAASTYVASLSPAEQIPLLEGAGSGYGQAVDPARRVVMLQAARAKLDQGLGESVRDAVNVLSAGRVPPGLDGLRLAAKGTRYENDLNGAITDSRDIADFLTRPLPEQVKRLSAMDRQATMTARDVRLFGSLGKAHRATLDGLAAGLDGEPDQVVATLGTLRDQLGDDGAAVVAGHLTRGKRPELAAALSLVPDRARDIVAGAAALKANKDKLELSPAKSMPDIEAVYGNLFEFGSGPMDALTSAADALYAERRIRSGSLTYDADSYRKALEDAAGGIVDFNGRKALAPRPDIDSSKFSDIVRKLKIQDLADFGNGAPVYADGKPFEVDQFQSRNLGLWSGRASLVTSGPGRYLLHLPGLGFVQTPDGAPYEFDMSAYLRAR